MMELAGCWVITILVVIKLDSLMITTISNTLSGYSMSSPLPHPQSYSSTVPPAHNFPFNYPAQSIFTRYTASIPLTFFTLIPVTLYLDCNLKNNDEQWYSKWWLKPKAGRLTCCGFSLNIIVGALQISADSQLCSTISIGMMVIVMID